MNKLFEKNFFDQKLKNMDSEINWSPKRQEAVKEHLFAQIEKCNTGRNEWKRKVPVYLSATAVVSIGFVGYQLINADLQKNTMDSNDHIAGWEQNQAEVMYEKVGYQEYELSEVGREKTVFPLDAYKHIPEIQEEPDIAIMSPHRLPDFHASYLLNDSLIVIRTERNFYKSAETYYEEEFIDYADPVEVLDIAGHIAIYNPRDYYPHEGDETVGELIVITDVYEYRLTGAPKEILIELANLFNFENEAFWSENFNPINKIKK